MPRGSMILNSRTSLFTSQNLKKSAFFASKSSKIKAGWKKCTAFFMKTAEFMQKFIENWRLFRENPKIRRLPKTVIPQAVEHTLPLIHNMLTTCANC
ncbi:MAG: hypothetical protein U0N76_01310 [Eubacteriales bacterium]|nr:hypothetical protein [Butyricicoccus sp. OF13-6]